MSRDRGTRQPARRRPDWAGSRSTGCGRGCRRVSPRTRSRRDRAARMPGGAGAAVVIDAAAPAGRPGTIRSFAWPCPELAAVLPWSTHGLGLVEALQLAESLGRIPRKVFIYTIEAGRVSADGPTEPGGRIATRYSVGGRDDHVANGCSEALSSSARVKHVKTGEIAWPRESRIFGIDARKPSRSPRSRFSYRWCLAMRTFGVLRATGTACARLMDGRVRRGGHLVAVGSRELSFLRRERVGGAHDRRWSDAAVASCWLPRCAVTTGGSSGWPGHFVDYPEWR